MRFKSVGISSRSPRPRRAKRKGLGSVAENAVWTTPVQICDLSVRFVPHDFNLKPYSASGAPTALRNASAVNIALSEDPITHSG